MRLRLTFGKREVIAALIAGLTVCVMGIRWADLVRIGPIAMTPAELGAMIAIVLFGALAVWNGAMQRMNLLFYLLLIHILILGLGFIAHGTLTGLPHLRRYGLAVLSAWALFATLPLRPRTLLRIAIAGSYLLVFMLWYSAHIAGVDLFGSILTYVTTLNRPVFLHDTVRALLNAFGSPDEVQALSSSVLNLISAAFLAYIVIFIAYWVDPRHRLGLWAWPAFGLAVFFVLVLFSSASMLVLLITVFAAFAATSMKRPMVLAGVAMAGVIGLMLVIASPVGELAMAYLDDQLNEDSYSRSSRLDQYAFALDTLGRSMSNVMFGVGHVKLAEGDFEIHNLVLFSWLASGIPGLLAILALYGSQIWLMIDALRRGLTRSSLSAFDLIQFALPMIFLIRTLVGGGGGIPDTVALYPAVIATLIHARRRQLDDAMEAEAAAEPSPVAPPPPLRRPARLSMTQAKATQL